LTKHINIFLVQELDIVLREISKMLYLFDQIRNFFLHGVIEDKQMCFA
jgi:hypothetical protein